MEQLQFSFYDPENVEYSYFNGAMFAYAPNIEFDKFPVELGDKILIPGQCVQRLGDKKRSAFEMQEGSYLQYVGRGDDNIYFSTPQISKGWYYTFAYISPEILLIVNPVSGSASDIRLKTLEVFEQADFN